MKSNEQYEKEGKEKIESQERHLGGRWTGENINRQLTHYFHRLERAGRRSVHTLVEKGNDVFWDGLINCNDCFFIFLSELQMPSLKK